MSILNIRQNKYGSMIILNFEQTNLHTNPVNGAQRATNITKLYISAYDQEGAVPMVSIPLCMC